MLTVYYTCASLSDKFVNFNHLLCICSALGFSSLSTLHVSTCSSVHCVSVRSIVLSSCTPVQRQPKCNSNVAMEIDILVGYFYRLEFDTCQVSVESFILTQTRVFIGNEWLQN